MTSFEFVLLQNHPQRHMNMIPKMSFETTKNGCLERESYRIRLDPCTMCNTNSSYFLRNILRETQQSTKLLLKLLTNMSAASFRQIILLVKWAGC